MPGLSEDSISEFRKNFDNEKRFVLAKNACHKNNPLDICRKRVTCEKLSHHFTNKIEAEAKPITDQKHSGRCWIFACLNAMRVPIMKELNIEELELSQNYVFFWDKVERSNFYLHAFVETAKKGEDDDGRLLAHLLHNPAEDGGQWQMLVNVIEKHGVVPKSCFPDTWSCENSNVLKNFLNNKLREYCVVLRKMVKDNKTDVEINEAIKKMNEELFRIFSICLGMPPTEFTWEYYTKDKKYEKVGPISPLNFYNDHVRPHFNMKDKVVLVNDPRPSNPYNELYTVEYLGNMIDGEKVLYINQEIDVLKKYAAESIRNNDAVWYGCDVRQHCSWKQWGFEDLEGYDFELVLGTSLLNLDKAERLVYGESLMTHAMLLTAFSEDKNGYIKWRIENSWGSEGGEKGYMQMTDDWFSQFVYEVVVDKKYLPENITSILSKAPKVLPAWDPMGALAV